MSERRGILLPVVLLYLLAITGVALTALAVVRSETLLVAGDLEFLEEWLAGEAAPGAERELGGGFLLLRAGSSAKPAHHSVAWRPDPARVADRAALGVEVGARTEGDATGVEVEGGGCGAASPSVFVTDAGSEGTPADPPLPERPRLGPIGIGGLAARSRIQLDEEATLTSGDRTVLLAPPDTRIVEGVGSGVLIGEGALELSGGTEFRGLIMVGGDLTVRENAVVIGGAILGGRLHFEGQGRIRLCPAAVEAAIHQPLLQLPFPLPGGARLGRF